MSRIQRRFAEGVFESTGAPEIAVRFPQSFVYLGRSEFVLSGAASVDRHHLVEPGEGAQPRAMAILHLESFLPQVEGSFKFRLPDPSERAGPDYRFSAELLWLGEHEYMHNTWFFDAIADIRDHPQAELAHTVKLLAEHGYQLPGQLMMSRYVRSVGPDARSELILFYLEPLEASGFSIEDFSHGGEGAAAVNPLSDQLTKTSGEVFTVIRG